MIDNEGELKTKAEYQLEIETIYLQIYKNS